MMRIATILLLLLLANPSFSVISDRPNILLFITDDQDVILGGTDHMPILQTEILSQGISFRHAYVHTPICCPSRTSILTGKYLHNGGARNNSMAGNCNGLDWQHHTEYNATFAVHAQNAGYQTGYAGKYLNQYGICNDSDGPECKLRVPNGWKNWMGLVGNSVYYNYDLVVKDGSDSSPRLEHHGSNYQNDYLPDVLTQYTISTIRDFVANGNPFLMVQAWPSPHAPFTPAPRDCNTLVNNTISPRTPNYNASCYQKHWIMQQLSPLSDADAMLIDQIYQQRLETLLTVDRNIADILHVLEETGTRNNTFIFYMSDNGFQLGQHRLPADKRQLYEHDIRIPLAVVGPGVPRGVISNNVVLNIDIAPTITEITTAQHQRNKHIIEMDGQSFLSLLTVSTKTEKNLRHPLRRESFLVSYHGEPYQIFTTRDTTNNTYHCVRTIVMTANDDKYKVNDIFCRFQDDDNFVEYYDMKNDEWQLHNAIANLSDDQIWNFDRRLTLLKTCRAASCHDDSLERSYYQAVQ